jgi:hypothetical protein
MMNVTRGELIFFLSCLDWYFGGDRDGRPIALVLRGGHVVRQVFG